MNKRPRYLTNKKIKLPSQTNSPKLPTNKKKNFRKTASYIPSTPGALKSPSHNKSLR